MSSSCTGFCKAQRATADAAAFEAEKAAIVSYEQDWDSWDGPVWDWRSTNKPAEPCTCPESKKVAALKRPALNRNPSSCSSISSVKSVDADWHASATPGCNKCGHGSSTIHI